MLSEVFRTGAVVALIYDDVFISGFQNKKKIIEVYQNKARKKLLEEVLRTDVLLN